MIHPGVSGQVAPFGIWSGENLAEAALSGLVARAAAIMEGRRSVQERWRVEASGTRGVGRLSHMRAIACR